MNETKEEILESKSAEVTDVKSDKKKVKAIIVVIVAILLCVLFGVGGWFLGTKFADKEANNNVVVDENKEDKDKNEVEDNTKEEADDTEQDTVDDEKVDSEDDKAEFVPDETDMSGRIDELDMKFGSVSAKLESEFLITKRKVLDEDEKETYVFALYRTVKLKGKTIADKHMLGLYDYGKDAEAAMDEYAIKEYKNIKDTKNGNSYVVVEIGTYEPISDNQIFNYADYEGVSYIINSDGTVLHKIISDYEGTGVMGVYVTEAEAKDRHYVIATDEDLLPDSLDKSHKYVLYSDDKLIDLFDKHLYYFSFQDGEDCEPSEHKVVIENGKAIDTKVRIFDDSLISAAGQSC